MSGVSNFGQKKSDMESILHEGDIELHTFSQIVFIYKTAQVTEIMFY
jgi:hypothetical protein